MIPDFEISNCPEHEVKLKIGIIFANEKILEEYPVKIYEIILLFISIIKKKYKLIKMSASTYLELMFILLNIFQQQKLMKKIILTEFIFEKKKIKSTRKKPQP